MVFIGVFGEREERTPIADALPDAYEYEKTLELAIEKASYIRAEVHTSERNASDGQSHFCITNPVWLNYAATG
jgi:hypothetical protein